MDTTEGKDDLYSTDGTLNVVQLLLHAQVLYRAGEFDLARRLYFRMIRENAKPHIAFYWLGCCARKENRPEEARELLEKSLKLKESIESSLQLAEVLVELKCLEEAKALLSQIGSSAALRPDHKRKVKEISQQLEMS